MKKLTLSTVSLFFGKKEALVYKEELLTLTYIIKMPPERLGRREERKVEEGVSSPKWPRKGLDS